jgi:hypothetical protein
MYWLVPFAGELVPRSRIPLVYNNGVSHFEMQSVQRMPYPVFIEQAIGETTNDASARSESESTRDLTRKSRQMHCRYILEAPVSSILTLLAQNPPNMI